MALRILAKISAELVITPSTGRQKNGEASVRQFEFGDAQIYTKPIFKHFLNSLKILLFAKNHGQGELRWRIRTSI
jgi:hypothetical protein